MIDTHTHLYTEEFEEDSAQAVERAIDAGVGKMIFPNIDLNSCAPLLALHEKFPANTFPAAGLHPTEVREDWRRAMQTIFMAFEKHPVVAIGEIGIDLYWDGSYRDEQMQCLEAQLQLAYDKGLPAIIHCRSGLEEVLEIASGMGDQLPPLDFHSFTGSREEVERIRKVCDPMFGINGVATFKSARELREAIPVIGASRIVLETDSPYLAPVPKRGRRNESSFLPHILECVAATLGMESGELEAITDGNAASFFGI